MKLKLIKFKKVKSTNDIAIQLIKKNKTKATLISSHEQTKGKGTMGKKWISKKGNLFLSILFQIDSTKINFKQYAILNALLIRKILSKYISKKINIKWPNDLLIQKRKVCGILQEIIEYKSKKFIIIGVGININSSPVIKDYQTTYLKFFSRKKINNKKILEDIKKKYEVFIELLKIYQFKHLKKKIG